MARKRQETLVLFKDVLNITEKFSDAQFGALMRAAFDYRFEGEGYQEEDALVELAFRMLEAQIDRYREACETNTKNAQREEPMLPAAEEVRKPFRRRQWRSSAQTRGSEMQRNPAKCSRIPLIIVRIIIPIIIIILRLIIMLIFIRRTRAAKSRPLLPFRRPAWRRCGRMQRRIKSILIQQSSLTFIRPTIGGWALQR